MGLPLLRFHLLQQYPPPLPVPLPNTQELQRLYFRSSIVDSDLHDAVCVLSDVEAEVAAVRESVRLRPPAGDDQASLIDECVKALADTRAAFRHRPEVCVCVCERTHAHARTHIYTYMHIHTQDMTLGLLLPRTPFGVQSQYDQGSPVTKQRLAKLHARLKKAQLRVQVLKLQRDAVVAQVELTEALTQGTLLFPEPVKAGEAAGVLGCLGAQLAYAGAVIRYHWHTAFSLCVLRLLACASWFLSGCFLWSEVVLGSPLALSPYGALQQAFGTSSPLAIQLSVAIPLAYVSVCAFRSLFKFKLFGEFCLHGPRQSLAPALIVNASYLIRLQFSLGGWVLHDWLWGGRLDILDSAYMCCRTIIQTTSAYNFLLLLRSPSSKKTAFLHFMSSNISVVPFFGRGFITWAPLALVLLAACTFFRVYARLLRLVGAYHEDLISGEEQEELIAQGRSLARRAKRYPLPSSGSAFASSSSTTPSQELGSPPIRVSSHAAYTQLKS